MIKDYAVYTEKIGVLETGTQYEAQIELQHKIRGIIINAIRLWFMGLVVLLISFFVWRRRLKRN